MKKSVTEELKDKLTPKKKKATYTEGLSTGSTLLNLACSGKAKIGFLKGKYHYIVGDSKSGKTWLSMTCLAEAAKDKSFDNYRFIYDNVEDGALMDTEYFFGKAVFERIECPMSNGQYSRTVEEFLYNLDDALKADKPCIYILDSMDSLGTEESQDKFEEKKKAFRKGKETTGSYGTSKAKRNSEGMPHALADVRDSSSILIIISQTRDNIGFGAKFNPKTRSGGHALRFYATLEIWSSVKENLTKTVNGKKRQIGITSQVKIKKNRLTGQEHTVEIPIYHSFGIDDVGSCVDFLVEEGHWPIVKTKKDERQKTEEDTEEIKKKKKAASIIDAAELELKGKRESLISQIETLGAEAELRSIVSDVWSKIEAECKVDRKRRYN